MTHEELLAKIDNLNDSCSVADRLAISLRAVVELHQEYTTADGVAFCAKCCTPEKQLQYPCPTIQAIEKELR